MPRPSLRFLGAVGTVTGSRFLVDGPDGRVLVDAGLYQGLAEFRRRNWDPFPVPPASLEAVLLTHAHLDHCGYLPRLARAGFQGPVHTTRETAELTAIVLRDSAHLQEEDAAYANRMGFSRHDPAMPLYDSADVERTLPLLVPTPLDEPIHLAGGVVAGLRTAGHILGSATISLAAAGHRVLFSGDLGRRHHPLLDPPADPVASDTLVVESTYGDRRHPEPEPGLLADTVNRTIARHGVVLIPAFAVDRTELVLLEIRRLLTEGLIPDVPVFLDSPMALEALRVYRRALERRAPGVRTGLPGVGDQVDLLDLDSLRLARSAEESRALNRPPCPCIVISASGMATGGRVVHHLEHLLPDPRNTVVLTGFQAQGTRGRHLLEGAQQLKMHGRYVPVRAEIVSVQDFSVHADSDELVAWLSRAPEPPTTVYVVHGEPTAAAALARRIRGDLGWNAVVPTLFERVLLD